RATTAAAAGPTASATKAATAAGATRAATAEATATAARTTRSTTAAAAGPTPSATATATAAGTAFPPGPAATATAAFAAAGSRVATAAGMAKTRRLAGAQYVAAGSCSTLGKRSSHLGAAWRLWRVLYSSGQLQPLFREARLVPDAPPPHDLHGVSAPLVPPLFVPAPRALARILGGRLVRHR